MSASDAQTLLRLSETLSLIDRKTGSFSGVKTAIHVDDGRKA